MNARRQLLIVALLLASLAPALAATADGAGRGRSGIEVAITLDNIPLAGASVAALSGTNSQVAAATTASDGGTRLSVAAGNYNVRLSFVGSAHTYLHTVRHVQVESGKTVPISISFYSHGLLETSRTKRPPPASQLPLGPKPLTGYLATLIATARAEIGQHEEPFGSNKGGHVTMYERSTPPQQLGIFWCAAFTSWAAHTSGIWLGPSGWGNISISAIIDNWAGRADVGLFAARDEGRPKEGDLVVYFPSPEEGQQGVRYGHIGIVSAVGVTSFDTIEGNTYWQKGAPGPEGKDYWVASRKHLSFHSPKVMGYIKLSDVYWS